MVTLVPSSEVGAFTPVKSVPAQSRGAALGGYSAFLDLALGVTGPAMGGLATAYGYTAAFFAVGAAVASGGLLTLLLWVRSQSTPGSTRRWLPLLPFGAQRTSENAPCSAIVKNSSLEA